jgi:hypothetical protein
MGSEMYYQIACSGVTAGTQSLWGFSGGCVGPPASVVPLQLGCESADVGSVLRQCLGPMSLPPPQPDNSTVVAGASSAAAVCVLAAGLGAAYVWHRRRHGLRGGRGFKFSRLTTATTDVEVSPSSLSQAYDALTAHAPDVALDLQTPASSSQVAPSSAQPPVKQHQDASESSSTCTTRPANTDTSGAFYF